MVSKSDNDGGLDDLDDRSSRFSKNGSGDVVVEWRSSIRVFLVIEVI